MESFRQIGQFDDYDAFTEATRSWDLDYHQLDCGPFASFSRHFGQEGFVFTHARFNRALLQSGLAPEGLRTLVIPTEQCAPMQWRRQQVTPEHVMIFPKNGEFDCVTTPGFDVYSLSLPEDYLDQVCGDLELPNFQSLVNCAEVIQCRPQDIRLLLRRIDQAMAIAASVEPGRQPIVSEVLKRELAGLAVSLLIEPVQRKTKRPLRLRDRAIDRALNYIHANGHTPITSAELCRIGKASERTLEYGFRERFGMTPKSYLLKHRLNGVRRRLSIADSPKTKIANLANQWGFWHMGQFAADYRKFFGELPSETLGH